MNKRMIKGGLFCFFVVIIAFLIMIVSTGTAQAKYCPNCGTYNKDSNAFCTKCGADLKLAASSKKPKVGIIFVASVYPYQDAKFTIYHKATVTPFIVWNSEGKYEIGEVNLPTLPDIEFVPCFEKALPNSSTIIPLCKRYGIDKLIVLNMNAKKVDRAPLFSSQKYCVYLDVLTYLASSDDVIQEKRYEGTINSWPDITVTQVKETCNGVWQQFVPNIYNLLRR